jgi:hypothetical protein
MTPQKGRGQVTGTAAAPLLHWLLLVSGLALVTVLRAGEHETTGALWLGSVAGTALGQLAAWRRLRLWVVAFLLVNLTWVSVLMMAPLWVGSELGLRDPWDDFAMCLKTLVPALICGYLSLSERGALAAFWFPAVLWMVAILDRTGPTGATLESARSRLLLGALAALLVAFLHARETRRVALWRGHATVRLAEPRRRAVLRVAPLHAAAQVGWAVVLGALTLALTTWIAPHLWQHEELESREASPHAAATAPGSSERFAASCCPETLVAEVHRTRVREYLPLLHGHDEDEGIEPPPASCIACRDGVAFRSDATGTPATGTPTPAPARDWTAGSPPSASVTPPSPAPPAKLPPASTAPPMAPSPVPPPVAPATATAAPAAPPPVPLPAPMPEAAAVARAPRPAVHPRALPPVPVAPADSPPTEGLLALAFVGMALHVAARALRRLLTVRHLSRPFWAETVDQRVSNLWQLMLVGLRDAGVCPVPGEQPQELSRRIGLEGMATCATVLERARHGVRVDRADLEAMSAAALSVYQAARLQAGGAARAAAWLRWPLV